MVQSVHSSFAIITNIYMTRWINDSKWPWVIIAPNGKANRVKLAVKGCLRSKEINTSKREKTDHWCYYVALSINEIFDTAQSDVIINYSYNMDRWISVRFSALAEIHLPNYTAGSTSSRARSVNNRAPVPAPPWCPQKHRRWIFPPRERSHFLRSRWPASLCTEESPPTADYFVGRPRRWTLLTAVSRWELPDCGPRLQIMR